MVNRKIVKKYYNDSGDLVQTVIIMAAMTMVGILGISIIADEISEQGSSQADCMANSSSFITATYQNDCGQVDDSDPALVIMPGYSDPYPAAPTPPPTPTPPPPPTPTPPIEAITVENKNKIRSDLASFASLVEDHKYYSGGSYPQLSEYWLGTLNFKATTSAYPSSFPYNLDYCKSTDGKNYILTVHLDGSEIMYVSSKNQTPVTYTANFPPNGDDAKISPCYNNTPYSASDHAGLTQFGIMDSNGTITGNKGTNGLSNGTWKNWTK